MRNKYVNSRGYVMVRVGFGSNRRHGWEQYEKEHIIVMERAIGRRLRRGEKVHHINGDKTDNRIKNLLLTNNKEHGHLHANLASLAYGLVQNGVICFCRKRKMYRINRSKD